MVNSAAMSSRPSLNRAADLSSGSCASDCHPIGLVSTMSTEVGAPYSQILRSIPSLNIGYAIRRLLRTPVFTVTAVATLAICIGANVAIFAVVDGIVLRSLPFPDAGRLVFVYNSYPRAGLARSETSIPDYFDWRNSIKAFASVSITHYANVVVGGAGYPQLAPIERVTPEYFATLGLPLAIVLTTRS